MGAQVAFSKYEAALLLEAYLKVLSRKSSRIDSAKECSQMLRLMAFNSGVEIDDAYRNIKGISSQMERMESAYQGMTITKPATQLFLEMVDIFRNDRKGYQKLLEEAKNMASTKLNNENVSFKSWLSAKVSSEQLSDLCKALVEIEKRAKKLELVKDSLYDALEPSIIKNIMEKIEQSQVWKFIHYRQLPHIYSALNYLLEYADNKISKAGSAFDKSQTEYDSGHDISQDSPFESLPNQLNNVLNVKEDKDIDAPTLEGTVINAKIFDSQNVDGCQKLDLENPQIVKFSKPVLVVYSGAEIVSSETSWSEAYVNILSILYAKYEDSFPVGMSFVGANRVDLCKDTDHVVMVRPREIAPNVFIETNLSAKDIVKRIKSILNFCHVSYTELSIFYKSLIDHEQKDGEETSVEAPKYYREDKEAFYRWLKEYQHMADATCRSYVSAIRRAEQFAEEHGFVSKRLYTPNVDEANATANELFVNKDFVQYNKEKHNRFKAAIANLLVFYGRQWEPGQVTISPVDHELSVDTSSYKTILIDHFPKGFRLESALDMKRFKRYYEEFTGTELVLEQSKIESIIRNCGIVYEGRLYMPQTMLSEDMKDQLIAFIERCFDDGRSAVFYEAIFHEFSEKLLDHCVYNSNMLKAYLSYCVGDKYYMGRSYLSKEIRADVDPVEEVRQCLMQHNTPVQVDEICSSLSHIEKERVRSILGANSEFVRNSKGEYFHASALDLTEEEIENIIDIIELTIKDHRFISGNELYEVLKNKYPYTFERNTAFSIIGWRDALKYRIGDKFSFVGNIISKAGAPMSMSDVFTEYGKWRSSFTLDELEQFAESLGTVIYFDALYTYASRISDKRFVTKNDVNFSVDETDRAIERVFTGDYIPINSVTEFALFPDASFPWNEYLLEQYVAFFSKKFRLLHGNFNKNSTVGAIVRKNSKFDTFDDLVIEILANSNIALQKKEGLDYLAAKGYIARRSYTNIDALIIDALAKRNQKEKR